MYEPAPLAESTRYQYATTLRFAFSRVTPPFPDRDFSKWSPQRRLMLRAAVRRACIENGIRDDGLREVIARLPAGRIRRPEIQIPGESAMAAYEDAARRLEGSRGVIALVPLACGLRSRETLSLTRTDVHRAAVDGVLFVTRKGGKRARLPVHHAKRLFAVMDADQSGWKEVGEIMSGGKPGAQYSALRQLVRKLGAEAGISGFRPHLLRHVFAQRMLEAGASIGEIKEYLGHEDIATTSRYLHPDLNRAAKFLREF